MTQEEQDEKAARDYVLHLKSQFEEANIPWGLFCLQNGEIYVEVAFLAGIAHERAQKIATYEARIANLLSVIEEIENDTHSEYWAKASDALEEDDRLAGGGG